MKRTLLVLTRLSAFSLAVVADDNEKTKPDNTATNERDRSGETQHLATSQTVLRIKNHAGHPAGANERRRAFNDCEEIKVITADGHVTLRGPVKTAQEKAKIDQLAKSAAGGAQIDNQLDVKGSN